MYTSKSGFNTIAVSFKIVSIYVAYIQYLLMILLVVLELGTDYQDEDGQSSLYCEGMHLEIVVQVEE